MVDIREHVPFIVYMFSSMLVYAGVDGVLALVSSVNIEHGLGEFNSLFCLGVISFCFMFASLIIVDTS